MNNILKSQMACLCIIGSSSVLLGEGEPYFAQERKQLPKNTNAVGGQPPTMQKPIQRNVNTNQGPHLKTPPNPVNKNLGKTAATHDRKPVDDGVRYFDQERKQLWEALKAIRDKVVNTKQPTQQTINIGPRTYKVICTIGGDRVTILVMLLENPDTPVQRLIKIIEGQNSTQIQLVSKNTSQTINGPKNIWSRWENRKIIDQVLDNFYKDTRKDFEHCFAIMGNPSAPSKQKQNAMRKLNLFYLSPNLSKSDKERIEKFVRDLNWKVNIFAHATYFKMNPKEIAKLEKNLYPNKCPAIRNTFQFDPQSMTRFPVAEGLTYFKYKTLNDEPDVLLLTKEFFSKERQKQVTDSNGLVLSLNELKGMCDAELFKLQKNKDLSPQEKEKRLTALSKEVQEYLQYLEGSGVEKLVDIYNKFNTEPVFTKRPFFGKFFGKNTIDSASIAAAQAGSRIKLFTTDFQKLETKIKIELEKLRANTSGSGVDRSGGAISPATPQATQQLYTIRSV
ncbi:MAG: hypothetical protein LBG09_00520 [Puniceicoccales bacterium]|jgi:hypothetical protein|nr:hypothetical protein [Puniceicoccales bacterium]